jgi:hypothetical protein
LQGLVSKPFDDGVAQNSGCGRFFFHRKRPYQSDLGFFCNSLCSDAFLRLVANKLARLSSRAARSWSCASAGDRGAAELLERCRWCRTRQDRTSRGVPPNCVGQRGMVTQNGLRVMVLRPFWRRSSQLLEAPTPRCHPSQERNDRICLC